MGKGGMNEEGARRARGSGRGCAIFGVSCFVSFVVMPGRYCFLRVTVLYGESSPVKCAVLQHVVHGFSGVEIWLSCMPSSH